MGYRTKRRIASFFHAMDLARRIVLGVLFWMTVVLIGVLVIGNRNTEARHGNIIVVHPQGSLVDAYSTPVSYRGVPIAGYANETLLSDLVESLRMAGEDDRIRGAWVYLDDLYDAGPAAAGELADAIAEFRETGKHVIATADTYDNARYRIASPADRILVDRLGEVFPAGYGSWRAYYAEGLERLGGDARLFRSGESKTGGETFIRDDMSEAARRDETRLLGDIWETWLETVSRERNLDAEELADWIDSYDRNILAAGGDGSLAAMEAGLVDAVETGGVIDGELDRLFGDDGVTVDSGAYLGARINHRGRDPKIGVVPIVGTLVYGEGTAETAGSADIVDAIYAARETPGVEALVLRIDSPGGDVRAGEAVRRALEETRRDWDLPIVASMGNLAASGGYWIALESDLIVTRPETITGSIGVYSVSLTFEQALSQWLGIRIDGYGTTPWSGSGHPGRTLDERTATLYQSGVSDIDSMFRALVRDRRSLDRETVDRLAGGIPWSGTRALELGLADQAGGLVFASQSAAELADLDDWQMVFFDKFVDPRQEMIGRLLWGRRAVRSATERSGPLSRKTVRGLSR